jgi:UDP-N-acetyl-L-fucosamine synthase
MSTHKKLKVMTVLGTRPEVIRLSRIIACFNKQFQHVLVHTGQNYDYELNGVFFKDLELRKPDYFLKAAEKTSSKTIAKVISKTDDVLAKEMPDALLILGDTNSSLAALPAKRRKIPVFHMEAGNRCFDQRVPEEINRKIVDHISDINLPYSSIAREYLISEGFPADRIIKTGSPMGEVLAYYETKINASSVLNRLNLSERKYFVASFHREENIDLDFNFNRLIDSLQKVAKLYKKRIIVSTHPRTRNRIKKQCIKLDKRIELLNPLSFSDYVCLQKNAIAVLSDSGTITEESSILNFPALNIREAHERPEGMEDASAMMVGLNPERIMQGLSILKEQSYGENRVLSLVDDYNVPNVSLKIVRIIISYVDYIKRTVWFDHPSRKS